MKSLLVLIFMLVMVSCSSIQEINKPVCTELSMSEAHCTYIISGESFTWSDENLYQGMTWYESRPYHILVPVDTWKAFKTYIQKQCRLSKKCNVSTGDAIKTVDGITEGNHQ